MISNVEVPHPVEYLKTGDHALLVAWVQDGRDLPMAVLCLEDGSVVSAFISEFKFDYRYDISKGAFIDVSSAGAVEEETEDADTDQEPADDGSQGVQGQVPEHD